MIPHQILKRVLSRLFIFKTSRMLCLKQNTKGGLPLNRSVLESGINSITSLGCLVRSAALMSASRPNLSLGTQVAVFTALCVLNYITSTTSLVRSAAIMSASRPNLSLGTQGYRP
jgi:hypothetical protein